MLGTALVVVMILGLLLVPFGLPGLWVLVGAVAVAAATGEVGPGLLIGALLIAAGAELAEFLLLERLSARYGGSRRAFWGALLGGFAGVLIGFPIPIIGPVVAGLLGSFLGAAALTWLETREAKRSGMVGWGAVLGRAAAAAAKMGAGLVILVWTALALILR